MNKGTAISHWPILAGKFLAGQGVVLFLNLLVGFLFLRILPKNEYALYISAGMLLAIASLGSDLGLSQAMNSLGAKRRDDKSYLGALFSAAFSYRRKFFLIAAVVTVSVAFLMFRESAWNFWHLTALLALILATAWLQCQVSLRKSILNIHHDAPALFHVGMREALVRLALVTVCFVWPTAITALGIGFLGLLVSRMAVLKVSSRFIHFDLGSVNDHDLGLKKFIIPLVPGIVYYLFQGQISIFLLNIYGYTSAVAEVGALGRLGQLLGLVLMLNPFLLQPSFARIDSRAVFISRVSAVVAGLLVFSLLCVVSVVLLPQWWLFLLGPKYAGLRGELPIAIAGALFTVIGASLYTIVISRNFTRGQAWAIAGGLGSQALFLFFVGVHSAMDALLLNILPLATYAALQFGLVIKIAKNWEACPKANSPAGGALELNS